MKYIKTFEQFVNESSNEDEHIAEGKIEDIENEIESLMKDHDDDPEVITDAGAGKGDVGYKKYFKRIEKLQDRLSNYIAKKEEYRKVIDNLDADIKKLDEESETIEKKIKDNEASLKLALTNKASGMSFNGIMNDNKNLIKRNKEISDEIRDINKKKWKILDKIESI